MPTKRVAFYTLFLFVILVGLAFLLASSQAESMRIWIEHNNMAPVTNYLKSIDVPDHEYYFTINLAYAMVILLIPANAAFLLRRADSRDLIWLTCWTTAWLIFLVHLWSGIFLVLGGTDKVFDDTLKPPRVAHPYPDTFVAVWWAADVILAWTVPRRWTWIWVERSLLHIALYFSALMATILLSNNAYVRALGVVLAISTLFVVMYRTVTGPLDPNTLSARAYTGFFRLLNRWAPWYRLSTWGGLINIGALRIVLRQRNLFNTSHIRVTRTRQRSKAPDFESRYLVQRSLDGYFNDLGKPGMGGASDPSLPDSKAMFFVKSHPGARFGRNIPLDEAFPDKDMLTPSPRRISKELLARREFIPAPSLNFLAAAWIQFQTHDWFNHGEPVKVNPFEIPLDPTDEWPPGNPTPGNPMKIRRTRPDPTRNYGLERRENGGTLRYPPTYVNAESHWWDASQIYGSRSQTTSLLRGKDRKDENGNLLWPGLLPDGKLLLNNGNLMLDPHSEVINPLQGAMTGSSGNWWAGLSLLHTLFAREHNAICEHLKHLHPNWDSERLFNTARMINSALMAKIHTVEWTPGILANPALEIGMPANWWGLETERLYRAIGRISENEAFGGIPLSGVDHNGADFCLTEEFVSVYRMHPLMRDDLDIHALSDGRHIANVKMMDGLVGNLHKLSVFKSPDWNFADVLYSFGIAHPGAVTIHNFPTFLRELTRPDGEIVDLAAIDVLRDRERGVPRYNRFLKLVHKRPIRSFNEFDNPALAVELRNVYGADANGIDNVDKLDLMVGLFCEKPPPGFGFSDTAFRIFILMASRRLKSDRFIAKDFTPEVYTQTGIDWVRDNSFVSVLLRHFPELGPALYGVKNGFAPWNDISKSRT